MEPFSVLGVLLLSSAGLVLPAIVCCARKADEPERVEPESGARTDEINVKVFVDSEAGSSNGSGSSQMGGRRARSPRSKLEADARRTSLSSSRERSSNAGEAGEPSSTSRRNDASLARVSMSPRSDGSRRRSRPGSSVTSPRAANMGHSPRARRSPRSPRSPRDGTAARAKRRKSADNAAADKTAAAPSKTVVEKDSSRATPNTVSAASTGKRSFFRTPSFTSLKSNKASNTGRIRGAGGLLLNKDGTRRALNFICYLCGKELVENATLRWAPITAERRRPFPAALMDGVRDTQREFLITERSVDGVPSVSSCKKCVRKKPALNPIVEARLSGGGGARARQRHSASATSDHIVDLSDQINTMLNNSAVGGSTVYGDSAKRTSASHSYVGASMPFESSESGGDAVGSDYRGGAASSGGGTLIVDDSDFGSVHDWQRANESQSSRSGSVPARSHTNGGVRTRSRRGSVSSKGAR